MRTVVVTTVRGRHDHLARQHDWLARGDTVPDAVVVVAMGDERVGATVDDGPLRERTDVVHLDAGEDLPLATARNTGATRAWAHGAELCVFLDVDCLPAPAMLAAYADARRATSPWPAVLCGPVSYLPPPGPDGYAEDDVLSAEPHPARPCPEPGEVDRSEDWELFWSLSFALDRATWRVTCGFDEGYVGYGGEDTDFGQRARRGAASLFWVGGARAFHQWHPVSDPPVEHVADIVANANRFKERWGWFPMSGWLHEFRRRGLVRLGPDGQTWSLVQP
jgi:N-acetylglucosaminyl-diphospho-decaprenol L-rhamnosyltransferase